jgi:hypothetical protein
MSDIRAAIQALLDADPPEGWSVGQFVIVMSLERINSEGAVETTPWYWAPTDQADWMTDGLLDAAMDLRAGCDFIDDD